MNRHGLPQKKKICNYYSHLQELNAYQKLHGLCLRTSGTSKKTINKLSELHDCVSYTTLTNILNSYSEESKKLMAQWSDTPIVHCGDNLDVRSRARFEGGKVSYHDIHMYNNIVFKARVPVQDLSDDIPTVDVSKIDYNQFLLDKSEQQSLLDLMKSQIKESWRAHISDTVTVSFPANKYAAEMKLKTEKVINGILLIVMFFFSYGICY